MPHTKEDVTILIIEDDEDARAFIRKQLKTMGFKSIVEASDGANGLSFLASSKPDLILCDWNMPAMSGLEVLQFVKQNADLAKIPFAMLTSEATVDKVKAAMQNGVQDYIVKSCPRNVFSAKLEHLLQLEDPVSPRK